MSTLLYQLLVEAGERCSLMGEIGHTAHGVHGHHLGHTIDSYGSF